MPNIDVSGLVTREVKYGENSRILTVLSKDFGKISVLASRARTNRSGLLTATQLFAYSNFSLFKGRGNSLLKMNEGEVLNTFSEIRNSLDKMAYASYFCDITNYICTDEMEENEMLALLLNVLYMLDKDDCNEKEQRKLEVIFLFRALLIAGFSPNCSGCSNCQSENDIIYFDKSRGGFVCKNCRLEKSHAGGMYNISEVNNSIYNAIKYIVSADNKQVFAFDMSEKSLKYLAEIGEDYLRLQLEHDFRTLDYLKNVRELG